MPSGLLLPFVNQPFSFSCLARKAEQRKTRQTDNEIYERKKVKVNCAFFSKGRVIEKKED